MWNIRHSQRSARHTTIHWLGLRVWAHTQDLAQYRSFMCRLLDPRKAQWEAERAQRAAERALRAALHSLHRSAAQVRDLTLPDRFYHACPSEVQTYKMDVKSSLFLAQMEVSTGTTGDADTDVHPTRRD